MGNYLNNGSFRGAASGFKLDTLLTLADMKARDRKTSLLQFVAQELMRTTSQVKFLSKELSSIKPASNVSLDVLKTSMGDLHIGIKQVCACAHALELYVFAWIGTLI